MKTLRHNRILLGWFMTLLVFTMQVATPLQSATIYWTTDGTSNGQIVSGTWNTTTANWMTTQPTTTAGTQVAWPNTNSSVALFGSAGNSTTQNITLGSAVTANGLQLLSTSGFVLKSGGTVASPTGSLTFVTNPTGPVTPTITLGSGSTNTAYSAMVNAVLNGTDGLTVQTGNTGANTTARLVMGEAGTGANFANNLTGGITVGNKTTLEAVVRTGNNNPLGNNAITLQAGTGTQGAALDLTGTRNSSIGISGRLFNLPTATSDTSRVDFTGVATGESLPSQTLLASGASGKNVVTLSSVAVGTGNPATTASLSVGQTLTGAGVPAGAQVGQILNGTQFTVVDASNQELDLTSAISTITVTPVLTSLLTSNPSPSLPISPTFTLNGLDGSANTAIHYLDANNAVQTVTNYAVQWVGKVNITTAGGYTFFAKPDDAARIYIDGVLVLNNDGTKSGVDLSSAVLQLGLGYHDIRVDYLQTTGGGSLDLEFAGPQTSNARTNLTLALYQAETNTAAASSNAIALGNDVRLTGTSGSSAGINLKGNGASSYQLGGLQMNTGLTLNVKATDSNGTVEIAGGGGGFGQTLRFAGSSVLGSTAGTVTINANPNVAFDGSVSDGGLAMTLVKTGVGRLFFNQTGVANNLGVGHNTLIEMQASNVAVVPSVALASGSANVTLTSVTGLTPGMTLSGTGIPAGAFIVSISGNTLTLSAKATASGTPVLNISATPTLVLTGSTASGAFNPIGSAVVRLNGGNMILDSKGSTLAGVGPTFANDVLVTKDATIQSTANASTVLLGAAAGTNSITITSQSVVSTSTISSGRLLLSARRSGGVRHRCRWQHHCVHR